MKTLIIYATKTGVTEDCALKLQTLIPNAVCYNVSTKKIPDPAEFDRIVLGTSVYMGMALRPMKKYIQKNLNLLLKKPVALFTCGANEKMEPEVDLVSSLPIEFLKHASPKGYFGYEIRPERLGFFFRIMIQKISRGNPFDSKIDDAAIVRFAEELTESI